MRGYPSESILLNSRSLSSCVGEQLPARTFLLLVVLRGGHPNGCREAHYLFSWTFGGGITGSRRGGYSWGPPRGQAAKVRVSVLAISQDSFPDIGNIESDNLRDRTVQEGLTFTTASMHQKVGSHRSEDTHTQQRQHK